MLKNGNTQNTGLLPIVFVLTLFIVLAVLSSSVIQAGSGVYGKIAGNIDGNYELRVALSYVNTKIRQNDAAGCVWLEDVADEQLEGQSEIAYVPCLVLSESDSGQEYRTYIYYRDGAIRELFIPAGDQFNSADGLEVVRAGAFTMETNLDDFSLYRFIVADSRGKTAALDVAVRSASISSGLKFLPEEGGVR